MENRVEKVFDKETSFRTLEIVNSWITAADSKSSIFLAFIGILVGLTANMYGNLSEILMNGSSLQKVLVIIFGAIYIVFLGLTIFHLISVFIARTKNIDSFSNNLVSFVSIAETKDSDYINSAREVDEESFIKMILSQIAINSGIANRKMKHFNNALKYGLLLIPLTIFLIVISG